MVNAALRQPGRNDSMTVQHTIRTSQELHGTMSRCVKIAKAQCWAMMVVQVASKVPDIPARDRISAFWAHFLEGVAIRATFDSPLGEFVETTVAFDVVASILHCYGLQTSKAFGLFHVVEDGMTARICAVFENICSAEESDLAKTVSDSDVCIAR